MEDQREKCRETTGNMLLKVKNYFICLDNDNSDDLFEDFER